MAGRKRPTREGGATLGDALAHGVGVYRQARSMSQADLADALTELGIPSMTQRSVAKVENGERAVSFEEAVAFAVALEVPLALLFLDLVADGGEAGGDVALTPTTTVPTWFAWQWWRGEELLPGHTNQWARDHLQAFEAFARYIDALHVTRSAKERVARAEVTRDENAHAKAMAQFLIGVDGLRAAFEEMERYRLDTSGLAGREYAEMWESIVNDVSMREQP